MKSFTNKLLRPSGLYILLACVGTNMALASNLHSTQGPGILYFGFFFGEDTASSMKSITDSYLNASMSTLPEFATFLQNVSVSANITNPYNYFTKPLDPNSGHFDPLYHVTAKYCGNNQKACAEYEAKNLKLIDTKFEMNLVGYVVTSRTFGIRVALTGEQRQLFDDNNKIFEPTYSKRNFKTFTLQPSSLPGEVKLEQQKWPPTLPVTSTKAHVTLGCAPGVAAVVTGPDALQAMEFEQNNETWSKSWNSIPDPLDSQGQNMRVTLFKPTPSSPPSDFLFVIYPRVNVVANATLARYYQKPVESASVSIMFSCATGGSHYHSLFLISVFSFFYSRIFNEIA